jgi:hypothetical protein
MNQETLEKHQGRWCQVGIKQGYKSFTWMGVLTSVDERSATYESKDGSLRTFLLTEHTGSVASEEFKA